MRLLLVLVVLSASCGGPGSEKSAQDGLSGDVFADVGGSDLSVGGADLSGAGDAGAAEAGTGYEYLCPKMFPMDPDQGSNGQGTYSCDGRAVPYDNGGVCRCKTVRGMNGSSGGQCLYDSAGEHGMCCLGCWMNNQCFPGNTDEACNIGGVDCTPCMVAVQQHGYKSGHCQNFACVYEVQ